MADEKKHKIVITTKDGKPMRIPPEGALGLLALGYKGLIAWRSSRNQYMKMLKQKGLLKNTAASKKEEKDKPNS